MIMDKKELIDLISILINELERDLNRKSFYIYQKDLFNQLSYEKWALSELLKRIAKSENGIYATTEKFCLEMDRYSMIDNKTSRMFSAAYDAAMNVLDLIVCSEENRR